jgi:hypothetical protein
VNELIEGMLVLECVPYISLHFDETGILSKEQEKGCQSLRVPTRCAMGFRNTEAIMAYLR